MEKEIVFTALNNVLSKHFSSREYNLKEYQEESVCLSSQRSKWIVYDAERGNRYHEEVCYSLMEVCHVFIRKMTKDEKEIKKIEEELIKQIVILTLESSPTEYIKPPIKSPKPRQQAAATRVCISAKKNFVASKTKVAKKAIVPTSKPTLRGITKPEVAKNNKSGKVSAKKGTTKANKSVKVVAKKTSSPRNTSRSGKTSASKKR